MKESGWYVLLPHFLLIHKLAIKRKAGNIIKGKKTEKYLSETDKLRNFLALIHFYEFSIK